MQEHQEEGIKVKERAKKTKYKKKTCPIQCGKDQSNGMAYLCKVFRDKLIDERKELQKKVPLCITCLSRVNKEHKCPVGLCSNCSALTLNHLFPVRRQERMGKKNAGTWKEPKASTTERTTESCLC